ncbi:hypothetical protein M9H77_35542 [Catharanthus roseus]|uniref:Uncharacterized protein n=1 Tax=Catharanthus roseus TaxID=4058 RepID=A0ACB9ZPA2_CATRO|nr:hypothetical protein M9H77_35542 [Catharanthus roseus]
MVQRRIKVAFQENVGITEKSLVQRRIEDIGTLTHELGVFDMVDLIGRCDDDGRKARRLVGRYFYIYVEVLTVAPDTSTTSAHALLDWSNQSPAPLSFQSQPLASQAKLSSSQISTTYFIAIHFWSCRDLASSVRGRPILSSYRPACTRALEVSIVYLLYYMNRNHVTYIICCFQFCRIQYCGYAIQAYIPVAFGLIIRLLDHCTSASSGHVVGIKSSVSRPRKIGSRDETARFLESIWWLLTYPFSGKLQRAGFSQEKLYEKLHVYREGARVRGSELTSSRINSPSLRSRRNMSVGLLHATFGRRPFLDGYEEHMATVSRQVFNEMMEISYSHHIIHEWPVQNFLSMGLDPFQMPPLELPPE